MTAPRSRRRTTTLLWPLAHAAWRGVEPSWHVLSTCRVKEGLRSERSEEDLPQGAEARAEHSENKPGVPGRGSTRYVNAPLWSFPGSMRQSTSSHWRSRPCWRRSDNRSPPTKIQSGRLTWILSVLSIAIINQATESCGRERVSCRARGAPCTRCQQRGREQSALWRPEGKRWEMCQQASLNEGQESIIQAQRRLACRPAAYFGRPRSSAAAADPQRHARGFLFC